jgi:uncharacterized protein YyaL (SSP411 family)
MTHGHRLRTLLCLCAPVLLAVGSAAADDKPKDEPAKEKHTNRLSREISPYLLQHAHNPVDWYPWGDEAFAKAKKDGKLVFLSIGYSSCHWCHVMERESFSNEEVAKILNGDFVCIKVDREERPDVDHIYMTALNVSGNSGGWPLSMFLTADGRPIVGGTYWPADDKVIDGQTVHGFKSVLKAITDAQTKRPDDLEKQADKLAKATNEALRGDPRGVALVELDRDLLTAAVDALRDEYDKEFGGFGNAAKKFRGSKFPIPPYLVLLQAEAARTKSEDVDLMVQKTLDRMARGGIYDQLGGGFHRYSTERTWTVPHFEKMLYDNAQLLEVYARAYRETQRPHFKRVLQQTLGFVERELTSPDGGFYSALDADSEGEEGKFYVWTTKEIDEALTDKDEAKLFKKVYGLDDAPNFESKSFILTLPRSLANRGSDLNLSEDELEAKLVGPRQKLFDVRARRPRPFLDTKILTAWNGEMIAGAALAGQALGDKKAIQMAEKAADFVLKNLRTKDGRLLRSYGAAPGQKAEARLNAYLDDYAFFVHGLLCLHDVTGEKRWLEEAKALTDVMIKHYADDKAGAFYFTSNDHEKLFARSKDQYDGAQPSANSIAARNLVRLWTTTGDEKYKVQAEKSFRAMAGVMKSRPTQLTAMLDALGLYLDAQKKGK